MRNISTTDLAHRLRPVIARLARRMRQEAGGDLTPTQPAALATIGVHGPLTPSELAGREKIQRPTATRVLALLEERGLVTRTAETGSWLGLEHQHGGVGTRMRLMILHLLFEGLDAQHATSSAFVDNPGSSGVSRRIGYRENGVLHQARAGGPVDEPEDVASGVWAGHIPLRRIAGEGVSGADSHDRVPADVAARAAASRDGRSAR